MHETNNNNDKVYKDKRNIYDDDSCMNETNTYD